MPKHWLYLSGLQPCALLKFYKILNNILTNLVRHGLCPDTCCKPIGNVDQKSVGYGGAWARGRAVWRDQNAELQNRFHAYPIRRKKYLKYHLLIGRKYI